MITRSDADGLSGTSNISLKLWLNVSAKHHSNHIYASSINQSERNFD